MFSPMRGKSNSFAHQATPREENTDALSPQHCPCVSLGWRDKAHPASPASFPGDHRPLKEGGCTRSLSGQLEFIDVLQVSLSLQIAFADL